MSAVIVPETIAPDYARADLAYNDYLNPPQLFIGSRLLAQVPGEWVVFPRQLYLEFLTGAVAGTRTVEAIAVDPNGLTLFQVPAFASQGPSVLNAYTFATRVSVAYGPVGGSQVAPLPPVVLVPGSSFGIQVNGIQPNDVALNATFTVVKLPTGPPLDRERQALRPTPLVV